MSLVRRQRSTLVLIAVVAVMSPVIAGNAVWMDTSVTIAVYGLIALSVGLTWGQGGILSVAQAAFAAIGAYATAIATIRWGWSPYLGALLAIALPTLVAYPLARVVTRLGPLALGVATLAFGEIFYTAVREGGDFTGGYIGLSGLPTIGIAEEPFAFHLLAWGIVVVAVALYSNLIASRRGAAIRTVRDDRGRATVDGVNVPHTLSSVFSLAAGMAGLAGWLHAHYLGYLGPESLTTTLSITVLLMAIVGGAATALGPLLGAGLLTLADDLLPGAESQGLFFGVAVLVVMLIAPRGLLGLPLRLPGRRAGGTPPPATNVAAVAVPDATDRDPGQGTGVTTQAGV